MSGISKYKQPKSKYCPIGGVSNGRRNMYETGTCDETYYTEEEFEFLKAIDKYKQEHNRRFPTYHEILEVLKSLGYRKQEPQDARQAAARMEIAESHPLPFMPRAG
jgi:hypothetical protein